MIDPDSIKPEDLLSKAIHSTISETDPLGSTTSQVVLGDRRADGKIKKHLVKIRTSEGNRYYICNFCSRFGFMWSCEINWAQLGQSKNIYFAENSRNRVIL